MSASWRGEDLAQESGFERYHRALNRATWSGLATSRAPLGLDATLQPCRGARVAAEGFHRVALGSSHARFVKASGSRRVCIMLLVPTALAPFERYGACQACPAT
jgi:hypothetical protein